MEDQLPHGDIEEGKEYHCREEISGRKLTDILCIEPDQIKARFISYEGKPHFDFEKYLVIRTEENLTVSLHDNISNATAAFGHGKGSHIINIISNRAIAGGDAWASEDRIRRIGFKIKHAEDSLYDPDKVEGIARSDLSAVDNELLTVQLGDTNLKIWYSYKIPTESRVPTDIYPVFEMEFDEGVEIDEARLRAQEIVKFFSALTGCYLRASDISISRYSSTEEREAIKERQFKQRHRLFELRARSESGTGNEMWTGHQFAHCRTKDELAALINCLQSWTARKKEWQKSTTLMMESLSLNRRTMDANRLLTASKWLEEIPGTKSLPTMKEEDVNVIAKAGSESAKTMGYGEIAGRIAGAIRSISKESRHEQHTRLIGAVQRRLGNGLLDGDFLSFLDKASRYRGNAAHGHMGIGSDREFSAFCKAVYAIECLCYLLTIKDLPILPAGRARLRRHPIVQGYLTSYLADEN